MNTLDSIAALKVGRKVLDEFEKEMKSNEHNKVEKDQLKLLRKLHK